MIKLFQQYKLKYLYLLTYIQNYHRLKLFKSHKIVKSIGTGIIMPPQKHPSEHVKYGLFNSQYSLLLQEGDIFVPFDCRILSVSSDYSSIILTSKDNVFFTIYLDNCCKYIVKDSHYTNLNKDVFLRTGDKLFTLDIDACYLNGRLPIIAFCMTGRYAYSKVYFGQTYARDTNSLIYF